MGSVSGLRIRGGFSILNWVELEIPNELSDLLWSSHSFPESCNSLCAVTDWSMPFDSGMLRMSSLQIESGVLLMDGLLHRSCWFVASPILWICAESVQLTMSTDLNDSIGKKCAKGAALFHSFRFVFGNTLQNFCIMGHILQLMVTKSYRSKTRLQTSCNQITLGDFKLLQMLHWWGRILALSICSLIVWNALTIENQFMLPP